MRRIEFACGQTERPWQKIFDDPQETDLAFAVFHLTSHSIPIPPFCGRAQEFLTQPEKMPPQPANKSKSISFEAVPF
jgi:hypothetical protein